MLAILVLLTLIVYWPVYHYGFIEFDDGNYVFQNQHVHAGFSAAEIKYAFTTYKMGNWNPLLWISFYIDRWMFGIRPGAMHVENVLLHLVTGLLLWRFLFVATQKNTQSFVVAALFLIHPMHVESVAWISERKDVLSTPLLIGSMLAYVGFTNRTGSYKGWGAYLLMVVLFILSLMAKPMGVTLPALLLLLDGWPLRRWPRRSWGWLIIEKIPLFLISLVSMGIAQHSQSAVGTTTSLQMLGLLDRIDNAIVCYVIYIVKLFAPIKLSIFYQHPGSRPLASVVSALGLLLMITVLSFRVRQKYPYLIIGWLWFLGTLVPVIGLVQIGGQAMADRYSYLPSIGLFIFVVWGLDGLFKSLQVRVVVACLALAGLTVMGAKQVRYWRDSETLFSHAANSTDDNPPAHYVLAHIALNKGDLQRAVYECNQALRFGDNARAYNGLGNCWIISGLASDRSKAIGYYQKAIALDPSQAGYFVDLAVALRLDGKLDQARQNAQQALKVEPDYEPAQMEVAAIQSAIHRRATVNHSALIE